MTTPGFLPGARPTAAQYGEDLEDEKPVRNPKLEYSATDLNNLRHDVAFVASVSPLARLSITGAAGVLVRAYGIDPAHVTVTKLGAGQIVVDIAPAAGFSISDAEVTTYTAFGSSPKWSAPEITSALQVKVHSVADIASDEVADFFLSLF